MNSTITTSITTSATSTPVISVRECTYDSRRGFGGKVYAMWTDGYAYDVAVNGNHHYVVVYRNSQKWVEKITLDKIEEDKRFGKWYEVPFSEIHTLCQARLVEELGEFFPWELSAWKTPEEFEEYRNPQTLEGIIAKSLRDRRYFFHEVVLGKKKGIFFPAIEESVQYDSGSDIVRIAGKYYICQYRNPHYGSLSNSSLEEFELYKKFEIEETEKRALERKEHARKCGIMARKYGITFEISLRCFKGNEEAISSFVESLKKALNDIAEGRNSYDSWELSCGRNRRRSEIERLGIEIGTVDPNHIAEYILACLEAGKIIRKL